MLKVIAAALAGTLLAATTAPAQDWPNRSIRLIVPGGLNSFEDSFASMLSSSNAHNYKFGPANSTGGRGMGGAREIASAAPDGYTFGITNLSSLGLMPLINAWKPYHPLNDFTHVALLAKVPMVLAVSSNLYIKTLPEFIAYAKKSDQPLTFASLAVGSEEHLIGEAIAASLGIKVSHVAFRGTDPERLLKEVIERKFTFVITPARLPATTVMPARGLTGLAVTSAERMPLLRDMPTFKELGYDDLVLSNWYAMSGPAKLPKDMADTLNRDLMGVLTKPPISSRFRMQYMLADTMSPEGVAAFVAAERNRWAPVIKRAGVTAQDVGN
jgi:tripartite-type tricarboxylate transporter receptor subunit TctC